MDLSITYITSKLDLKTVYYALGCFAAGILLFLASERFENFSRRWKDRLILFSSHQVLAICFVMLAPISIRMLSLPWHPPPIPEAHDEFGHLFVADTLSHGRLANPKHDLSQAFETQYILQSPSYSSIYPLGKGAFFAVGKLFFRIDWAGVLLEVALMSGAITWMLYGCIHPSWAFIGGLIAAFSYGMDSQWLNSYWGGGGGAFGGALVFGSLFRFANTPSARLSTIMSFGWSIVSFVRPFESIFLCLICCSFFAWNILRDMKRWRDWKSSIGVFLLFQIFTLGVTFSHNKAVTGSFTLTPYQFEQKVHGVPQNLLFQKPVSKPDGMTTNQPKKSS